MSVFVRQTTGRAQGIKREYEHNRLRCTNTFWKNSLRDMLREEFRQHLICAAPLIKPLPLALKHDGDRARRASVIMESFDAEGIEEFL